MKLDYVLALRIEDFLERRLQTQVFKLGLAKSIHHASVLITQRHIRVGNKLLTFHHFWSDLTLKNTLTSLLHLHMVVVYQARLRERTKTSPAVVMKVPKKKKSKFYNLCP